MSSAARSDAKMLTKMPLTFYYHLQAQCNIFRVGSPHCELHARHQARHRCSHAIMVMHAAYHIVSWPPRLLSYPPSNAPSLIQSHDHAPEIQFANVPSGWCYDCCRCRLRVTRNLQYGDPLGIPEFHVEMHYGKMR
jgi:hypothetical protein